ncbi:site-specific DNA-methyltransferase [Iodobacter violaceini]|nr:site-specific DNA-methyltransferase [Iodobacter violacea]
MDSNFGKEAMQLDLFSHVSNAYVQAGDEAISNASLYVVVAEKLGRPELLNIKTPVGSSGEMHNLIKRKIRWFQQTLKQLGVIERVQGERGVWRLTEAVGKDLHKAADCVRLVAFSTDLGVAIWGHCKDIFTSVSEPISLCITSPPYPLRNARAYGNPAESEYIDFICSALEPIVKNLIPGASVVLNLSSDIFLSKSPARSLYVERLVLSLHDRLGLFLMDRIPWVNKSKPPGPTYWACVNRVQLTTAYEPIFWFTNDPLKVRSDNRRVLEPHSDRQQRLMAAGGAKRSASYGDGAYKIRPDSFGRVTEGKIARNVLERGHACSDTKAYREYALNHNLPVHGAMFPTSIPEFFIQFLTEPNDLVVDCFGGTIKTGLAAERLGRRWMSTELIIQYLRGAAGLFQKFNGFEMHPALRSIG